jgi:hypothetical protein
MTQEQVRCNNVGTVQEGKDNQGAKGHGTHTSRQNP